ncbi:MAG: neutral zinc metallopeptidase [Streptococcus parasanguinis]
MGLDKHRLVPFYCPTDKKIYLDMSFYKELTTKYKASWGLCHGLRDRPRSRPPRTKRAGNPWQIPSDATRSF